MTTILDAGADGAIGVYQRFVSPYKGFCCAYRAHTGRRSCSAYARAIVQRLGAQALPMAMKRQFARCRAACLTLATVQQGKSDKTEDKKSRWWDGCDLPFDCCDFGACDCSL